MLSPVEAHISQVEKLLSSRGADYAVKHKYNMGPGFRGYSAKMDDE